MYYYNVLCNITKQENNIFLYYIVMAVVIISTMYITIVKLLLRYSLKNKNS